MANKYYSSYLNTLFKSGATDGIDFSAGGTTIKAALINIGAYTFSAAHVYLSDISAGIVGTAMAITSKTVGVVGVGVFDGDDITYVSVAGSVLVSALLFYKDTGTSSTSPLIGLIDGVASGLPTTTDGSSIIVAFHAAGIFRIGT